MNIPRLIPAIVIAMIFIAGTDMLIHAVWLAPTYAATKMWRPEAEMNNHMPWVFAAQFLFAASFVLLWAFGFAAKNCLKTAAIFGVLMGLCHQAMNLNLYAVMPLPGDLVCKWFLSGLAQCVLLALITFWAYKPKEPVIN